jgi:hypothetical protein
VISTLWAKLNARGNVWPVEATWYDNDGTPETYVEAVFIRRRSAVKYVKDYYDLVGTMPGYHGRDLVVGDAIPFWWFA